MTKTTMRLFFMAFVSGGSIGSGVGYTLGYALPGAMIGTGIVGLMGALIVAIEASISMEPGRLSKEERDLIDEYRAAK